MNTFTRLATAYESRAQAYTESVAAAKVDRPILAVIHESYADVYRLIAADLRAEALAAAQEDTPCTP